MFDLSKKLDLLGYGDLIRTIVPIPVAVEVCSSSDGCTGSCETGCSKCTQSCEGGCSNCSLNG